MDTQNNMFSSPSPLSTDMFKILKRLTVINSINPPKAIFVLLGGVRN